MVSSVYNDRPMTLIPIAERFAAELSFLVFTKQFNGLGSFSPYAEFILTIHFCSVPLIYWRCCPYERDRNNICDASGKSHFSRTDSSTSADSGGGAPGARPP